MNLIYDLYKQNKIEFMAYLRILSEESEKGDIEKMERLYGEDSDSFKQFLDSYLPQFERKEDANEN